MAKGITVPVTQTGLEQSIQGAAKKVGSISVPIDVDAKSFKNLSQPLGRITGLATEFEKSIAASNARVIAFGASVGIINGVQNALASLVTTTIEVQKNLTSIGVIFGKTNEELSSFSKGLFAVARETAQSFQTASEAALEFSRQGLSTEETLKRTKDALTLTRFTSLSAADAVDVLTAAVNSFSSSGVTTADILNKLVAVDTKFAVSSEDLAKGLSRAGSIAQEVGVSLDELNGIITVVQEKTARGGAVIGNAFKTIFTRIRSDETIKALQEIGIFSRDASGNLRPVVDILTQLAGKLNGLSEIQKIEVLEAVASKYNINSLNALLDDLGSSASKFQEIAGISANANNEAYARQVELNKTLDATIKQTVVSVTELANSIGEIGVTANLQSLLSFFNDIVSAINDFIDSESLGGDIAKGLISGISGVLFKIGLPILGAIFIKLTKDIAQFGVESLKTILGINQQVKERQALEQAVVNTLIRDRDVMAAILALSGDRTKQEEYLLNLYNRQIAALQQVQSIAGAVAPALVQGGLSATSGTVQKKAGRAAEGYLPAQEAADVKRGVGGADKNAKVVKIPNFSFGGGKKGTMYANTSEYVVPNYNGGDGTAIFNKDMVRKYGMPDNAKKINAANGYVPNFADGRYIYDPDRLPADKNVLLKKILASKVKKNLIIGPAGTGKTTFASAAGAFITKPEDADKATEIDILSAAGRTKEGGISSTLESIISGVNQSGGKVSYLYTGNMDIIARRNNRIEKGAGEGDLRSEKQIAGTNYAPLNQFDFAEKIKTKATNFGIVKNAADGYIPNFVAGGGATWRAFYYEDEKGNKITQPKVWESLSEAQKSKYTKVDKSRDLTGKTASSLGPNGAVMLVPTQEIAQQVNADSASGPGVKPKDFKDQFDFVKFKAYGFGGSRVNNEVKAQGQSEGVAIANIQDNVKKVLVNEGARIVNLFKPITKTPISGSEFEKLYDQKGGASGAAAGVAGSIFEAAMEYSFNTKKSKAAVEAINENKGKTFDVLNFQQARVLRAAFGASSAPQQFADYKISKERARTFADQIIANNAYTKVSANGYIPNYAEKLIEMYDWDGTIIPKISGKAEEYIQSLQNLQATDLLPIGKDLAASKAEFDIATIRPIVFREPIKQTAQRLGLKVDKIFPVGSMFDNRRTQGKKGERKLYGPERKALLAEGTGRSIVDDEEANLAALGSRGINANLRNRASFGFIPNFAQGLKQQDVLAPSGQFYDLDTADAFLAGSSVNLDPASPASKGLGQELKKKILASARKVYGPKAQIGISRLPGQREAFTSAVLANPALADDFIALQKATTGGVGPAVNTPDALAKFNNPTPFDPTPWPAIRATGGKARTVKKVGPTSLTAAFGFVPNFADPLQEAVDREISAGIKPSQVRVTQDDRLMTSRNPEGIAVINTRDEPNGKVPSSRINEKNGRKAAVSMAAKGFIPNFAEEKINVRRPSGMQKIDYKAFKAELDAATINFSQTNKTLDDINNASANLKTQITAIADKYKISGDKQQAIIQQTDKLIEARKVEAGKATGGGGAGGGTVPPVSAGAGAGGGGKGGAPKGFDAGKFLLYQSAIVGATSALQAFTEENSNASLAIEGAAGAASGISTGLSLAAAGLNPFVALIGGAVAGLTTLIPVFLKVSDKFETEGERVGKALVKLADQAEKTGEAITPEAFLAALEKGQKDAKTKTETASVREQVAGAARTLLPNILDEDIKKLSVAVQASGGVQEGKVTEEGRARLSQLVQKNITNVEAVDPESGIRIETKRFDIEKTIQDYKLQALAELEKRENSITATRTQAELRKSELSRKTVQYENDKIMQKLKVEQSIFDLQLSINKLYFERGFALDEEYNNLENQRTLITETEFLRRKEAIDRKKIEADRIKADQEAAVKLKSTLAGLGGSLGNVIGQFDIAQLERLVAKLEQFNKPQSPVGETGIIKTSGVNAAPVAAPDLFKFSNQRDSGKGAIDLVKEAGKTAGIDVSGVENLNNLSLQQRELLITASREYLNTLKTDKQNATQAAAKLKQALNQAFEQTAAQKLANEIKGLTEALKGEGDYSDRITTYRQGLIKSLQEVQLKNKLEAESGEQLYNSQLEAALSNNLHVENMREAFPIENRALISAINLETETEKKIDAIEEEIINTDLRLESERKIIEANNRKLGAENDAYTDAVKAANINLKLDGARKALVKSERDAEEQNQVAIEMVRQNFDADKSALDRKIELAKAVNEQILQSDYDTLVSKELTAEKLNLIAAQRKAVAEFNNLGSAIENFKTSFGTDQTRQITATIKEGTAFTQLGLGAGTLEKQAVAAVQSQRLGGRDISKVSEAEKYEIISGRNNSVRQNLEVQRGVLLDQAQTFQDIVGKQTPQLFADGMAQAMEAALSRTDDLGSALRGVATGFLKSLQGAFLQSASKQIVASVLPNALPFSQGGIVKGYATGGLVTGGSGYKDDVPAMLSEGEYVIRKSSVQKYGKQNLAKLNMGGMPTMADGGFFIPGFRGQESISGIENLQKFASQTTTSGATDVMKGGPSSAFINLEDQSMRLSRFALLGDDTINQEIRDAQQTALDAIEKRRQYDLQKQEEKKQFKKQLVTTILSAAVSYGTSAFLGGAAAKAGASGAQAVGKTKYLGARSSNLPVVAYGGEISRYASGGQAPVDNIPALLMGGEYVMSNQATKKYGKQFFDSINQGRAPRFAAGGEVGGGEMLGEKFDNLSSKLETRGAPEVNITVNVTGSGASETKAQGESNQGGIDYKKMSERIKAVVMETINEEKRLGGSLRSR